MVIDPPNRASLAANPFVSRIVPGRELSPAGTRSQATSISSSCASSQAWVTPSAWVQVAHAERGADAVAVHARGYRARRSGRRPRPAPRGRAAWRSSRRRSWTRRRVGGPASRAAQERLAANEAARLVPGDAEAEPRRERDRPPGRCRGPSGGSPSRCGRRSWRGSRRGPDRSSRPACDDPVEDMGRELGRDIELPAQLADIGDPARPDAGIADLQLARGAERERRVATGPRRSAVLQQSRERGPMRPSIGRPEVMSTTVQRASAGMWRPSQARSRVWTAAPVTTRKLVSSRRVTVRSASMPPCSLHHCV